MNLKLLKLIRLFHLIDKKTYNEKRYVEIIKRSIYFNETYYRNKFDKFDFTNMSPAEHYLKIGYKKGVDPSLYFSSKGYLEENPDVQAVGMNPLLHYEIFGKHEGRYKELSQKKLFCSYGKFYNYLRKLGRIIYKKEIQKYQQTKILVHLHIYYTPAWIEIKEYLKNLSCYPYDLIVTYTESPSKEDIIKDIKEFKQDAKIIPYENKGFDIGPFVDVLSSITLDDYDIVYHIHSKSIAGKRGRIAYGKLFKKKSWFKQLYGGCLGVLNVHRGIKILSEQNNFGLIGANNLFVKDMPKRIESVKKYAALYNLTIPSEYEFLIGSCFGIRAKLLTSIQKLHLSLEDFHDSQRGIFTLAHALERLFATEVINKGYRFYKLPTLHNNHPLAIFIRNLSQKLDLWKVVHQLKKYYVSDIELLELDIKSGLKCLFLKGTYKGKAVFIKYGGVDEIAQNEAKMQQLMHKIMPKHVPAFYLYNQNPTFVVMDFINGSNLEEKINFGITKAEQKSVLSQLEEIKSALAKHNFVHRDIQPANLVYAGDQLYLIDYQFMVEKKADGSLKELNYVIERPPVRAALGGSYRCSETGWDDGYSLNLVKERIAAITISPRNKNH